jgi:hypothetical protein
MTFMLMGNSATAADVPIRLRFEPQQIQVAEGKTARVQVITDNIPKTGLACFQFTLRFKADLIDVVNPNEAFRGANIPPFSPLGGNPLCPAVRGVSPCPDPIWNLTATGRAPLGVDRVDQAAGVMTVAYGTQGKNALPAGGGALAVLDVVGQKRGRTKFTVEDFVVCDDHEPPQFTKKLRVRGGTITVRR